MDKTFYRMSLRVLILVTGSMGLFACSSSDEPEAPAKPLDPTNTVKTQFAISVPRSASGGSRMSAENTQNTSEFSFLGMQDIILIPTAAEVSDGAAEISTVIALPNLVSSAISSDDSHKLYNDVSIPVGTKSFLFYGKALKGAGKTKAQTGSLTSTLTSTVSKASDITFALDKIISSDNDGFGQTQNKFEEYLKTVIQSKVTKDGTEIAWLDLTTAGLSDETLLARSASKLIEMKAGSATAIKNIMNTLYIAINRIADDTNSYYNALAKEIQNNIKGSMFTWSGTELEWLTTLDDNITKFPENFGVPQGSVAVNYDKTTHLFAYISKPTIGGGTVQPGSTTVVGGDASFLNVASITYPAELYYWVNTFAHISNTQAWETKYTPTAWETATTWTGWNDTQTEGVAVATDTRKIALKNNINYAVGCLATTITCSSSILLDKATDYDDENGVKITQKTQVTVPDNGFPVVGILVGGQPNSVDWNFESLINHNSTIYDNDVFAGMTAKNTAVSNPNYTLVLDNHNTIEETVKVAVELLNPETSVKFYGQDGIVYPGSRFYMIATLDPATGTKPDGDATIDRVFLKDYKTTANFTIKSLENAYVTVPDLRATQLQLGLSVDLEWQQGLTFNADL